MDVPLLHAISEGAINTLRNFKVQEISSLLWSLSSMSVLDDGERSCRIVQQLSAAPIIVHEAHSGQSWQAPFLLCTHRQGQVELSLLELVRRMCVKQRPSVMILPEASFHTNSL